MKGILIKRINEDKHVLILTKKNFICKKIYVFSLCWVIGLLYLPIWIESDDLAHFIPIF